MQRSTIIVTLALLGILSVGLPAITIGPRLDSDSSLLARGRERGDTTLGNGSTSTVVYVDPQNVTAFPGETFVITVKVANVTNLYGLDIQLTWDPAIIKYVNHTVMIPMDDVPGGILHKPIMMVKNEVNEVGIERKSGVFEPELLYWVACVSFTAPSSFNGTGTVFSMAFEVINI